MKQAKKSPKYQQLKVLVRSKYLLITAAILLVLGSSAFAYHTTHNSNSLQQQATSTGDALQVSDAPSNLKLINGADGAADEATSQPEPSTNQSPAVSKPRPSTTPSTPSRAGCNWYSDVPYKTVNEPDSSMPEGQTKIIGGVNGSRKVCTDAQGNVTSDEVTYPPVDKTIYYGTYTREQAMSDSRYECTRQGYYQDSTDYGDCVGREMRKRGF